ncbi:putative bifunctional diguanylate cyclase/phosphodiesterase [Gracilibacillus salinarum]|uniref:Bifunctional diguanylate cyclase/phosphodiesterase n=1 Tax=Gracilibacillus salinarum TaxID=2932255 RepID=A0ABY4GJM5_9BACI|nr:bifunctional diguanylate cyclase/phosphodiesterase [Gracilibacillus salinarum]UOQ84551.1 bifunctional diguanylate cyclase/phosphodiesterase [Gracilibacillus salinarum]
MTIDHYKQVDGEVWRHTLDHHANMVFVIDNDKNKPYCSFVAGRLSVELGLSQNDVNKEILSAFSAEIKNAMNGRELKFRYHFKQFCLCIYLSPVFHNQQVIKLVGTVMDITPYENAEKTIEYMATHDKLTKLPNRYKLFEDLSIDHQDKAKAVFRCDLDRLKNVNDTFGQEAGDEAICKLSERLRNLTPEYGSLYRLNGDEFVLIVERGKINVHRFAANILSEIQKPIIMKKQDFYMTCTIGVSYLDDSTASVEACIDRAGVAVHHGKVNGGNRVYEYTEQLSKQYNELLLMASDIRKAFQYNEFTLSYQPKVDVGTDAIVGVEALIRWEHGKKGKIPPSVFIPIAEEIGMIDQIGEWVLRKACQQFVEWKNAGTSPVMIAVNISAVELQQPEFLPRVKNIIEETGMDPDYLEIEITENSVMQNTEACIQKMNELRKMGVSLSIDDFGTGYSSMGYLQKFPINYLKIDQSFIKELFLETGSAEIIKAMIQLGHTFGLKVVAEGVEGEQILSFIKDEKCDYYQGYLYSKPLEAELIEAKLLSIS